MSISTLDRGKIKRTRQESWLQSTAVTLRENDIVTNLIGLLGAAFALFMLLRLPEPWNLRIPFYLVILVWTILRPRVALYLMPIAVPWGSLDAINVGTASLNSADLLVGFLAAGWFMSFALHTPTSRYGPRDRDVTTVPRYLILAIVALIGMMFLSMTVATSISSSLKEIVKWLEFLVLVLLGAQYLRTRRQIWALIVIVLLAGITQAFYGYIQDFYAIGPAAFIRDASLRVYGTFGQPNPFAGYLNLPLSIAIALVLLGSNWKTRILAALAAISLGYAEYLTLSRGGEIAITVAVVFILFLGFPGLRALIGPIFIAGLGVVELFLAGVIPQHVLNPVYQILGLTQISFTSPSAADYSTAERLAHWIAGIHMFLDHPWLGVGIGNYPDVYQNYYITIFVNSLGHAHNYYINIAAEMGAIGLTVFLLFLFALFLAAGNAYYAISTHSIEARAASRKQPVRREIPAWTINTLLMRLSLRPISLAQYNTSDSTKLHTIAQKLANDRALAVGLLAALLTVCVHNLVDDLYVHSMTNLLALLLIALIRLEGITANGAQKQETELRASNNGG
ncbi:MAG TPA: O-antigen ligase family protein [Ktedonobacteraceae bacterium]|nr:O-antigen ligase family protein [Ktedonobacteraceae bacterium]